MSVGEHVVVVLSYHGRPDTERCLGSLLDAPGQVAPPTVLVIDNGSYDGVLDAVARRWPQAHTLQSGANLGFSGGMNLGLRWALDRGADVVTILNNDTIVSPQAMSALASVARGGAAVSPEVRYADGSGRVWFGGGTVDRETHLARHLSPGELAVAPVGADGLRATEVLAGCCVSASATTWQQVGLLDDRYFLIFEDSDWSLRATAAGVPLVVDPRVAIEHSVSASFSGAFSYLGAYFYARNGLLFGRTRCGASLAMHLRFLRRHALPPITDRFRRGERVDAARQLLVLAVAVLHAGVGRFGPAPAWLERAARSWAAR